MLEQSIFAKPVPPNPATSTIEQRRKFIVQWTRAYTHYLAVQNLLDPPQPEPELPELPEPGDPMPEHLAAFWDNLTNLERALIKGGRIWQEPASEHWTRISCIVDIFRERGLPLRDALQMCRFDDGLGRHNPEHARTLQTIWRMRAPDYQGPGRYAEHVGAIFGIAQECGAPAQEIALIVKNEWQSAEAHALKWMEALRRRLWPMCRAEASESEVIAAAREVGAKFNIYAPDEFLFPVLDKIEIGARPNKRRRRHV